MAYWNQPPTGPLLPVSIEQNNAAGGAGSSVDVLSIAAGNTNIGDVDVASVPAPLSTTGGGTEAAALRVTVASDSTGVLSVDDNGSTLTVDAPVGTPVATRLSDGAAFYDATKTGQLPTALVGGRLDENVGAWLGSVAPTVGSKTSANSVPVVVASDQGNVPVSQATAANLNAQVVGTVAHDGVDSGNPEKIGARAVTTLATATMVAAADRTDLVGGVDGAAIVRPHCPLGDILSERITDTAGTSVASAVFTAVASTRNYITTIMVYNSNITTSGFLDIRDGTAGAILMTVPLPANGGAVIPLPVPLRQPTANVALAYDVSAAITTVYISVVGFQSKV